jgi:N-dimethylarginine dimethylaminohydrolase
MPAQFLVCPPTPAAFPGSDARRQWDRLIETVSCTGNVRCIELGSALDAPGLTFISRGAFIVGNLAIVSSFRLPEYRREQGICRRALSDAGLATTYLYETYFEGAADALFDRVRPLCYAGYGPRSERSATLQLADVVSCRVLPLMLDDERFVHLDTALCPLSTGHVLVHMPAFSSHAQTLLRRAIDSRFLIDVSIDDALELACNALEIGDALVFHRVSRNLRAQLNEIGYRVFCTELDAFVRAGGSAKSLMLRLDDGPVAVQVAS